MATLPTAADYGARVKLQSNRLDVPGSGEMAVADALARAAGTFTQMAIEHKQKDDALSYANAKNDYMIADIQEREKLKLDEQFATHDPRYREAMKGHYDRLFPTVRSERDRVLFDAEARLMNERGSVAVRENARTKELDYEVGRFRSASASAKEIILAADDAQTAQDAMFAVLEHATALRQKGIFDNEEYQAELQAWVQDAAFSRLIAMDPKKRQEALERSITARKTSGEPITKEQIMEGKGTGSIADFLHLDTAVKMLDETKTENTIDEELTSAYDLADKAAMMFPESPEEQAKWARDQARILGFDGTTRQRLEGILSSRGTEYRNNKNDMQNRVITSATELMSEVDESKGRPWTYEEIPASELRVLEPQQRKALEAYSRSMQEGRQGFGKFNQWVLEPAGGKSYALWRNLPDGQKSTQLLDDAEWKTALTRDVWQSLKDEQDRIRNGTTKQLPSGLTNVQMVTSAIVRTGLVPQIGRDVEDYESYQRLLYEFDRATQAEQDRLNRALTNTERDRILGEIMAPTAFTDRYAWFPNKSPKDRFPIAAMSTSQLRTARLPWAEAEKEIAFTSPTGISVTYASQLRLMATKLKLDPDDDDYERAYFALKQRMGSDEVEARLRGQN
jgi:hypothetical protein